MRTDQRTIQVFVRSRRVPIRIAHLSLPMIVGTGTILRYTQRVVIYDYALNESQKGILTVAQHISSQTGSRLNITDVGKEGVLRRIARSLVGGVSPPSVSITGSGL